MQKKSEKNNEPNLKKKLLTDKQTGELTAGPTNKWTDRGKIIELIQRKNWLIATPDNSHPKRGVLISFFFWYLSLCKKIKKIQFLIQEIWLMKESFKLTKWQPCLDMSIYLAKKSTCFLDADLLKCSENAAFS